MVDCSEGRISAVVAIGGIGVAVMGGPAGALPQTATPKTTRVNPNICCNNLLLFIAFLLFLLE
jgi:hypothetical protein